MKSSAYVVALNFGEGAGSQLHVICITAPSAELAVGHAVATVLQALKLEQPLTRIVWDELREEFLASALGAIRGGGDQNVVSLRAVEPVERPTLSHDWVLATNPALNDRAGYACQRCGDWREYTDSGDGVCVPNRPL